MDSLTSETIEQAIRFAFGLGCGMASIIFMVKDSRRIICGVLMVLSLYFTVESGLLLLYPNTLLPEGEEVLGRGEETIALMSFALMLASLAGGIVLFANGIRLMRKEWFSLSHSLPCLFGLAGILWPFAYVAAMVSVLLSRDPILFIQIYTLVEDILMFVPGMVAAVLLQSAMYAMLPKPVDVDFILVLGAGLNDGINVTPLLASRLERGIRAWQEGGCRATIVVSGGLGDDEAISEAQAMKEWLKERGVGDEFILMEDISRNTDENIAFSKEIMDAAKGKDNYRCLIATSNYHVFRSVILARKQGLNAQGIGARTALYYLPDAFLRECFTLIYSYRTFAYVHVACAVALAIFNALYYGFQLQ